MSRWDDLTARLLDELETCEEVYRPTTFWGPGIRSLLDDLHGRGLESFKSWPSAAIWFYPTYAQRLTPAAIDAAFEAARRVSPNARRRSFRSAFDGRQQAQRDFDALRLAWDQARWPFDLEGLGESEAGAPPQGFQLARSSTASFTRPYLNYLLCLAGLSRHVDRAPVRFLELGGGFGVLGEIVLSRDPDASYVDVDLPPLLTVASSYLDTLFGDRVTTYESLPASGAIEVGGSACLPNWRIRDVRGPFDVFVNSLSFQEMEPEVVARYADDVASLGVTWVVSLNSRAGKPVKGDDHKIGVITPVTSRAIVDLFEARGYRSVATYGDPLLQHQAELAILRKLDGTERLDSVPAVAPHPSVDLRRTVVAPTPAEGVTVKRSRGIAGPVRDVLRGVRRRLR